MSFNKKSNIVGPLKLDWIERSIARGREMVGHGPGGMSVHTRATASHGAENNWALQAVSAMGECAHAAFLDLDPVTAVKWTGRETHDIRYRHRWNYDTKTVDHQGKKSLIWPINKWPEKFEKYEFDILVLVKQIDGVLYSNSDADNLTNAEFMQQAMDATFEIYGWVGKDRFRKEHLKAPKLPPGKKGLTEDTPYMDQSELDKFAATCAQCHGRPDGTEQPFFDVMLHKECVRFYEQDMLKEADHA